MECFYYTNTFYLAKIAVTFLDAYGIMEQAIIFVKILISINFI